MAEIKRDEFDGIAALLKSLMEKYADELGLEGSSESTQEGRRKAEVIDATEYFTQPVATEKAV